jgi:hypothetical protein
MASSFVGKKPRAVPTTAHQQEKPVNPITVADVITNAEKADTLPKNKKTENEDNEEEAPSQKPEEEEENNEDNEKPSNDQHENGETKNGKDGDQPSPKKIPTKKPRGKKPKIVAKKKPARESKKKPSDEPKTADEPKKEEDDEEEKKEEEDKMETDAQPRDESEGEEPEKEKKESSDDEATGTKSITQKAGLLGVFPVGMAETALQKEFPWMHIKKEAAIAFSTVIEDVMGHNIQKLFEYSLEKNTDNATLSVNNLSVSLIHNNPCNMRPTIVYGNPCTTKNEMTRMLMDTEGIGQVFTGRGSLDMKTKILENISDETLKKNLLNLANEMASKSQKPEDHSGVVEKFVKDIDADSFEPKKGKSTKRKTKKRKNTESDEEPPKKKRKISKGDKKEKHNSKKSSKKDNVKKSSKSKKARA